jgi:hypothetical protein
VAPPGPNVDRATCCRSSRYFNRGARAPRPPRSRPPPREWLAPAGTSAPLSDPTPPGRQPRAWSEQPSDWRPAVELALRGLPLHDLTFVGPDGFPICVPASDVASDREGFRLRAPRVLGTRLEGPACLTFHTHEPGSPPSRTVPSSGGSRRRKTARSCLAWSACWGTGARPAASSPQRSTSCFARGDG